MTRLCPSHITLQGPVRAVPGLFWTEIVSPLAGPVRTPCGAVRILPPRTVPQSFNACIISLRAPYGLMPQSHPTTGPVRFLSPARFLARKTEWSARRNFTSVLFSWSHQATGSVRLGTAVHLWFGRMIRRTPWVPLAAPYGHRTGPQGNIQCFSYPTGPYETRKGAVQHLTDT